MKQEVIQLLRVRLLNGLLGLVEVLQSKKAVGKIRIRGGVVRSKTETLVVSFRGFLVLSQLRVRISQIKMRPKLPRVILNRLLIRLYGFIQLPADAQIIIGADVEFFTLAGMVTQLECLGGILRSASQFAHAIVIVGDTQISHGEVWIKLDGALIVRQSRGGPLTASNLVPHAVCFQGFERRGGGLGQRDVKFLYRSQGFPQLTTQLGGGLVTMRPALFLLLVR